MIPIPQELRDAVSEKELKGDYLLSDPMDWFQPYDEEDIDREEIEKDFDSETTEAHGLLIGSVRICNTGCEGYHVYVFSGPHTGTIWSDQRVPFGRITKISDSLDEYIERIRTLGRKHITSYEKFR